MAEIYEGDERIKKILDAYGIDMENATWSVHKKRVILHVALERIATKAQIVFDPPLIVRAEQNEAVMVVTGRMGAKVEWATGEALLNANYKIRGAQSPYVYAMAEKRGKDRVILKLIELHGDVYSEDEAQDFKEEFDKNKVAQELMNQIDAAPNAAAIQELMNRPQTKADLGRMEESLHNRLREYAAERYKMFVKRDKLRGEVGGNGRTQASADRELTRVSPPPPAAQGNSPAKLPENASDRVKEDQAKGFGTDRTVDETLDAYRDELRYCHTKEEVYATTNDYRKEIESYTGPDKKIANQILRERLDEIAKADAAERARS